MFFFFGWKWIKLLSIIALYKYGKCLFVLFYFLFKSEIHFATFWTRKIKKKNVSQSTYLNSIRQFNDFSMRLIKLQEIRMADLHASDKLNFCYFGVFLTETFAFPAFFFVLMFHFFFSYTMHDRKKRKPIFKLCLIEGFLFLLLWLCNANAHIMFYFANVYVFIFKFEL